MFETNLTRVLTYCFISWNCGREGFVVLTLLLDSIKRNSDITCLSERSLGGSPLWTLVFGIFNCLEVFLTRRLGDGVNYSLSPWLVERTCQAKIVSGFFLSSKTILLVLMSISLNAGGDTSEERTFHWSMCGFDEWMFSRLSALTYPDEGLSATTFSFFSWPTFSFGISWMNGLLVLSNDCLDI